MKLTGRESGSRRRSGLAPESFARCAFAPAASRVTARSLCECSADMGQWNRRVASGIKHGMRALVAMAAVGLLGCRSAAPDPGFEAGIEGGVVVGILSCDVCAIALVVDAVVTDTTGAALAGVDVWYIPALPPPIGEERADSTPSNRAHRLGVTDEQGHVVAPECLMGGSEFRYSPPGPVVRLEFLLFREGWGATRVVHEVPVGEVLHTGYVLGRPMGDPLMNGYRVEIRRSLNKA